MRTDRLKILADFLRGPVPEGKFSMKNWLYVPGLKSYRGDKAAVDILQGVHRDTVWGGAWCGTKACALGPREHVTIPSPPHTRH